MISLRLRRPGAPSLLKTGPVDQIVKLFGLPLPGAPEGGSSVKLVALLCLGSPLEHVEE